MILKALHDSGFIIDSSIVPGFVLKSKVNEIDFSNVPKIANYYLDSDVSTPSKNNQGIFEIPIASCTFSIMGEFFVSILSFIKIFRVLKSDREHHRILTCKQKGIQSSRIQSGIPQENQHIQNIIILLQKRLITVFFTLIVRQMMKKCFNVRKTI